MAEQWLTIPEFAKRMCLDESTLRRLCREGKIPAKKVGAQWRILNEAEVVDPSSGLVKSELLADISEAIGQMAKVQQSLIELVDVLTE